MSTYNLQPSEALLLKEEGVSHGGKRASFTDELLLTSMNLVLFKKGTFGRSKGVHVFPLDQIKVYDGTAQALLVEADRYTCPVLEVYFLNGQETFTFQPAGRKGSKKVLEWVAKINKVVTGEDLPVRQDGMMAIPGTEMVAGVLKDTLGVFKTRLGSKASAPGQEEAPVQVASKCTACGAPFTGTRGREITCEYCGTSQHL